MFKILFLSIWFLSHPVHVTLTSIDLLPGSDTFNIFIRMYFDDFLLDSKRKGLFMEMEQFSEDDSVSIKFVEKYIKDNVIIKVNDKQLSARLLDMKLADNEISLNLVGGFGKKPRTISVRNLIMTGLYSDQANMVIIRINDFEEGVKLTSELTEQKFIIK